VTVPARTDLEVTRVKARTWATNPNKQTGDPEKLNRLKNSLDNKGPIQGFSDTRRGEVVAAAALRRVSEKPQGRKRRGVSVIFFG
jgi:hypothetical protein